MGRVRALEPAYSCNCVNGSGSPSPRPRQPVHHQDQGRSSVGLGSAALDQAPSWTGQREEDARTEAVGRRLRFWLCRGQVTSSTSTHHQHPSPAPITSTHHQHPSPAPITSTHHQHPSSSTLGKHLAPTQHTHPAHPPSTPTQHTHPAHPPCTTHLGIHLPSQRTSPSSLAATGLAHTSAASAQSRCGHRIYLVYLRAPPSNEQRPIAWPWPTVPHFRLPPAPALAADSTTITTATTTTTTNRCHLHYYHHHHHHRPSAYPPTRPPIVDGVDPRPSTLDPRPSNPRPSTLDPRSTPPPCRHRHPLTPSHLRRAPALTLPPLVARPCDHQTR
ncbi:hypothetical protein PMIN01_07116 [Paraphaeosphaeria minitans]|uniref:Uncharacterized protein n=1 Tax=Paraphaeosphaeria minitans TaxID=565426 RepID=A0A9P6KP20_9PLEO|nr:hypothetical protein PMIN01_07116 [Paraphaeosphaeria minitans]